MTKSTEEGTGPVSIPAGSFDQAKLQKGLDAVAGVAEEKRQAKVDAALRGAAADPAALDQRDQAAQPGFRVVGPDEHKIEGVTEDLRLYDPKLVKEADRAEEGREDDVKALQRGADQAAAAVPKSDAATK